MTEEQTFSRKVSVNEGAEAFIELLNANGVEHIFLSPGTDTIAVQAALANFQAQGRRTPRVIIGLHESVGMAAAHGYFMVTGRPQVVLVHADLGAQQVGGALHNAQRGRMGVILCAGRAPLVLEEDERFGRKSWVHWMIEKYDQAGAVRDYAKWYYELRSNKNIHLVVQRAFQVASTEPCGPVYLILPPELLMEKIDSVLVPDVARYTIPVTPSADEASLSKVAQMLIQAQKPLIITGNSGRHHQSVKALVELAETLSARVVTFRSRMSFPTNHPLWGGDDSRPYLEDADVILVIDHDVPYLPSQARFRPDVQIIQIDIDPVKKDLPTWLFPADILIEADSSKAIPSLTEIVRSNIDTQKRARFQARFQQIQSEHEEMRAEWRKIALSKANQKPISTEWLCYCIAEVMGGHDILLSEVAGSNPIVMRQVPRTEPGTLFDQAGSSLGWGLGAALGAKLAAPEKMVVLLTGDGSFVYGCPTAALWASQVYGAPFLCIIFRNEQYSAIKKAIQRNYEGSAAQKADICVGTDIVSPPNYSLVAQACGAYGQPVEEPDELRPALKGACERVRNGKSVVLDVRIGENP